jgi:hypothetical protein
MPTPRPGAGEVVVTTLFSGISGGTERLIYRGEFPQGLALDDTIDALGVPSATPFLTAVPASAKSRTWTSRSSPSAASGCIHSAAR